MVVSQIMAVLAGDSNKWFDLWCGIDREPTALPLELSPHRAAVWLAIAPNSQAPLLVGLYCRLSSSTFEMEHHLACLTHDTKLEE